MKKAKLTLLVILALFIYNSSFGRARVPYCTDCVYSLMIAELPDSAAFYAEEARSYVDVGYVYKQFWIAGVPIWNYEGQYCLLVKGKSEYYEVSEKELKALAETYHFDLPSNPVSFWNKAGGKLVLLVIAALLIGGALLGKKEKHEPAGNKEDFFTSKEEVVNK